MDVIQAEDLSIVIVSQVVTKQIVLIVLIIAMMQFP